MTNAMDMMLNDLEALLVLKLADDKLFLGHIQSDWTGLGPILEEDIASSSMAQDDLSHALVLYEYLGSRFSIDPDVLAYERLPSQYLCCDLVTVPDDFDWAKALIRRWFFAHYAAPVLDQLALFNDSDLVERCRRLRAEESLHISYLNDWMQRLSSGSKEAIVRLQNAIDFMSDDARMLFELPGMILNVDRPSFDGREELFNEWSSSTHEILSTTNLKTNITLPTTTVKGGRNGVHADHFIAQLTEMNEVRCKDPGAAW